MRLASLLLLGVFLAAPAAAQTDTTRARVQVRCDRLAGPIAIDGVLSEPVWQNGNVSSAFKQLDPNEGAEPTERTEVRVAYDDDALYVGVRCFDSNPDSIISRLVRRDTDVAADRFTVYLDPYLDRRSGYFFLVNAAGSLMDGLLYNDGWMDTSWDGVWEGKAKIDAQGWTAEMRIPYSQLRFERRDVQTWGINFARAIRRKSETVYLVYQPKKESGFVSRFPDLVGLDNVVPKRAIEVMPYVTGKSEFVSADDGNPFNDGSRHEGNMGADLRMGIGSKLTLNATINPDFGQVEVDPAVVNLSDVETFYPEKRPFFVENSSIFRFGNEGANDYWGFNWPEPMLFYSRRIGASPRGSRPDHDYADVPSGTSILGAAKLTGKPAPGVNFGTLHALTGLEEGEFQLGNLRWKDPVEPHTYYGVVRGQREFKERRRGLGAMANWVVRDFGDARRLENEFNRSTLFTGLDGWHFLDRNQMWVLSGWAGMSHMTGTAERIDAIQRNSVHRMQRPDARHLDYDPGATSFTGFGARAWLNKQKGNFFSNSAIGWLSPEFDVNDLGFSTRADVINYHVGFGHKWTQPGKWYKYRDNLAAIFQSYDTDGVRISSGVWNGNFIEFPNNWSLGWREAYNPETFSNRKSRGGPLMANAPGVEFGMNFDTDGKAKLFYFVEFYSYFKQDGSKDYNFFPGIEYKPVSNVMFRIGPSYARFIEDAMFLGIQDDGAAPGDPGYFAPTYGRRYLFGELDQTEIGAQIRLNVAFTPNLSLQTFVQPLWSRGDYHTFRELARGASRDFTTTGEGTYYDNATGTYDLDGAGTAYGGDDPDFNEKILRGNAVLRWEYRPGSALFLVWNHNRYNGETGYDKADKAFERLLETDGDDIFLAKLSYYFNL